MHDGTSVVHVVCSAQIKFVYSFVNETRCYARKLQWWHVHVNYNKSIIMRRATKQLLKTEIYMIYKNYIICDIYARACL